MKKEEEEEGEGMIPFVRVLSTLSASTRDPPEGGRATHGFRGEGGGREGEGEREKDGAREGRRREEEEGRKEKGGGG